MLSRPNYDKMLALFDDAALRAMDNMIEAAEYRDTITREIADLGPGVIRTLDAANVKIRSVGAKARIGEMSKVIARFGITLPPGVQGLYVPFDKALYIIEPSKGVVVHELAHSFDHVLAPNAIPADFDPLTASQADCNKIKAFRTQQDRDFLNHAMGNGTAVSAYGATNAQEFWAESVRAFCNVNDTGNLFDELSAPKYRALNRASFGFMLSVFHRYNGRRFEKWRHAG